MSKILALALLVCCSAGAQVFSSGIVRSGTFWGGLGRATATAVAEDEGITNEIIVCWPLDEASGTRADFYGNFDLTDNNTVTGTTGPIGIGNASSFLAANSEFLSHADAPELRMGNFNTTITLWVNPTATGFHIIMQKDDAGNRGYILYHDAVANKFHWVVYDTLSVVSDITSTGTFAEGSGWHFIVCGYDQANSRIFMSVDNGAEDTDAMSNAPRQSTAAFDFGANNAALGSDYFTGGIAAAAIWGRILTTEERTALWNSGEGLLACLEEGN